MRKIILALAMLVAGSAQAALVKFEVTGTIGCPAGAAALGFCSGSETWQKMASDLGGYFTGPNGAFEGGVGALFTATITVNTSAPPASSASAEVRTGGDTFAEVGTGGLTFSAAANLIPNADAYNSCPQGSQSLIRIQVSQGVWGVTPLCSSGVSVSSWLDMAALSDAELATFHSGFAEYDKFLMGDGWSAIWEAWDIRRVPLPGTLALMGLGLLLAAQRRGRTVR